MDESGCYLGLGLLLGALIGAFFAEASRRYSSAMAKIRGLEKEKQKAEGIIQKAQDRRRQGYNELPVAYLLFIVAIALLILSVYLIFTGEAF